MFVKLMYSVYLKIFKNYFHSINSFAICKALVVLKEATSFNMLYVLASDDLL